MLVRRYFAFFIDIIIVLFPVAFFFGTKDPVNGGYSLKGHSLFYIWIVNFLYFYFQELFWNASIGKRLFKLKVVKIDGSELTKGDVAKRHLLDFFEIYTLISVACIMVLATKKHQRLGDKLAKTTVVNN